MNFKEELQMLSGAHKSPLLDDVKGRLRKAASEGIKSITLGAHLYDNWVVNWLQAQGFQVEETHDQRDGSFIRITW